jgi:hypothetical protein
MSSTLPAYTKGINLSELRQQRDHCTIFLQTPWDQMGQYNLRDLIPLMKFVAEADEILREYEDESQSASSSLICGDSSPDILPPSPPVLVDTTNVASTTTTSTHPPHKPLSSGYDDFMSKNATMLSQYGVNTIEDDFSTQSPSKTSLYVSTPEQPATAPATDSANNSDYQYICHWTEHSTYCGQKFASRLMILEHLKRDHQILAKDKCLIGPGACPSRAKDVYRHVREFHLP